MSGIAARIRAELEKRGWSVREGSRRAGFSTDSQLGNVLRRLDENPSAIVLETLEQIAKALEVDVEWLRTGSRSISRSELSGSDTDSRWKNTPNWNECVAQVIELAPSVPTKVYELLGETRGLWAPSPMTTEWLLEQARVALKSEALTRQLAEFMWAEQQRELAEAVARSQAQHVANEKPEPLKLDPDTKKPRDRASKGSKKPSKR
ncbi:MAG: helix-turn-helix transcriptional regulator [Polyangiales bacterium]